jgi:alpha-L-rhamnosidase
MNTDSNRNGRNAEKSQSDESRLVDRVFGSMADVSLDEHRRTFLKAMGAGAAGTTLLGTDFSDAQLDSGELPVIIPTSDWGYVTGGQFTEADTTDPSPVWDSAYVFIPWWCYRYCGDQRLLEHHYEGMKRLVAYHQAYATDHIITTGHGDHLAPEQDREHEFTPEGPAITSTAYYAEMASVLSEIAGVLGHENDAVAFAELHQAITAALNREFFDADRGIYATGECDEYRQTSNILPLAFGLVPDGCESSVLDSLVTNICGKHDKHLDTGVVGTKHLFTTLTEYGHADLAFEIATQRTYPSYGYWIDQDASSLYEFWERHSRSRNHHMYASIDDWFYRHLAGVVPAAPGFETVRIKPFLPTNLDRVTATVETVRGVISTGWERIDERVKLDVTIPANTTAFVHVPGKSVAVSENRETERSVSFEEMCEERAVYSVDAGDWTFEITQ